MNEGQPSIKTDYLRQRIEEVYRTAGGSKEIVKDDARRIALAAIDEVANKDGATKLVLTRQDVGDIMVAAQRITVKEFEESNAWARYRNTYSSDLIVNITETLAAVFKAANPSVAGDTKVSNPVLCGTTALRPEQFIQ